MVHDVSKYTAKKRVINNIANWTLCLAKMPYDSPQYTTNQSNTFFDLPRNLYLPRLFRPLLIPISAFSIPMRKSLFLG